MMKSKNRTQENLLGILVTVIGALMLPSCGGGGGAGGGSQGDSGSGASGPPPAAVNPATVIPPAPIPPAIPPAPSAISGCTDAAPAWPGFTTVATPSTTGMSNGDAVRITGSTNPAYNGIFNVSHVVANTSFDIAVDYNVAGGGLGCPGAAITQIIAGGVLPPGATNCPSATTIGTAGQITVPTPIASRVTGVAPLAVFFDASATTSAVYPAMPFHDLEYQWDFDVNNMDPAIGTWVYGSRPGNSRRTAYGPVAGHVYNKAGIYNIELTVTDGTNQVKNRCLQVAVTDPDVDFAGNLTTCVSTSGNFAGCPGGAFPVTDPTGDFVSNVASYATTGKRLLFRAGDTWNAGATPAAITQPGPGIVGSYGGTARIQATANASAAILNLSSYGTPGIGDWRIMDLEFDGNGNNSRIGITSPGTMNQVTMLRLYVHNLHDGILFDTLTLDYWNSHGHAGHTMWDQVALQDTVSNNMIGAAGSLTAYIACWRCAIQGNQFDNNGTGNQALRIVSTVKAVVSNNTFQGEGPLKEAFTLRGEPRGMAGVTQGLDTQYVVVSDNKFIGEPGALVTVSYKPPATGTYTWIRDVITERNWFVAGGGGTGTVVSLGVKGNDQTIRNNLIDTTGGQMHTGIELNYDTVPASNVRIYNNTILDNDLTGVNFYGVLLDAGTSAITIENNLAYAPHDGSHRMYNDLGATGVVVSNNSSNAQIGATSPSLTAWPPVVTTDWKPTGGSYACLAGAAMALPVWSDFFTSTRIGAPSCIGAALP